ncbi:MAG: protein kinase [Pirellulaceae bacterium]
MSTDRQLLFGILAMQTGFISQDDLVSATSVWLEDKSTPLDQVLVDRGRLGAEEHALLSALVKRHLELYDNNPQKSLAAVGSMGTSIREELEGLQDTDVQASLAHISTQDATRTHSIHRPTAETHRFRILRPHARGGLGEVFVAEDRELNREVALKEIQLHRADDPESRGRFLLEAEITGRLEHPGIVPVYGLGTYADGRPYYAMRFVRGDNLKDAIRAFHGMSNHRSIRAGQDSNDSEDASRLPKSAFLSIEFRKLFGRFIDVCNAIDFAHSRGVLHRDIKPGNIMLGKHGETLVVDWGLAKSVGRSEKHKASGEATIQPSSGSGSASTQMGNALGTPAYMSPEQAAGRLDQMGPRSDVYCLGATLYSLLTGRPPVIADDPGSVLRNVEAGVFPAPRSVNGNIPKALESICLKAMSLDPADRYSSARELVDDAERWLADEPVLAHAESKVEAAFRWMRRHKSWTLAGSASLVVVTAALIVALFLINEARTAAEMAHQGAVAQRREAEDARDAEVRHRLLAESLAARNRGLAENERLAREQAEDLVSRNEQLAKNCFALAEEERRARAQAAELFYLNDITSAQREWDVGSAYDAFDLLLNSNPESRGWEYKYLYKSFTRNLVHLLEHESGVDGVAYSPDGEQVVSGSEDGTLHVWNLANPMQHRQWKGHQDRVSKVVFDPAGRLVSASLDKTLRIWDVENGREIRTLRGHDQQILALAISSDGARIVGGGADGLQLWDAENGQAISEFKTSLTAVTSVAYSPDGERIAVGCQDESIRFLDARNGEETSALEGVPGMVVCVAFSPDGRHFACGTEHGARLWSLPEGITEMPLKGYAGSVTCLAFSSDSKQFITGNDDSILKVWDVESRREQHTLKGHLGIVTSVAFSADGRHLLSGGTDRTVRVWDTHQDQERTVLQGHASPVTCTAFSPDGEHAASGSENGVLKVWKVDSGREELSVQLHADCVTSVAFDPGKQWCVSAGRDASLRIWNPDNGREIRTLQGNGACILGLAVSPDGRRIASGSEDGLRLWDAESGQQVPSFRGPRLSIASVAFGPDGRRIASGNADGTIRIWDARSGEPLLVIDDLQSQVTSLEFSPDGQEILCVTADESMSLWDAKTGQERVTFLTATGSVTAAAYSPDGKRIISGSDSGLKLWHAGNGQEVLSLWGQDSAVNCVAFSPDGARVISGNSDHTVCVWDAK